MSLLLFLYMLWEGFKLLLHISIIVYVMFGIGLFVWLVRSLIKDYKPHKNLKVYIYLITTSIFIFLLCLLKGYSDCPGNKTKEQLYMERVIRLVNFFYFIPLKIIFTFCCIYFICYYIWWLFSFWFELIIPNNYYPIIFTLLMLFFLNSIYFLKIFIVFIIYYFVKKLLWNKINTNYLNDYSQYNNRDQRTYKFKVLNIYYGDNQSEFAKLKENNKAKYTSNKFLDEFALNVITRKKTDQYTEHIKDNKLKIKFMKNLQSQADTIGLTKDEKYQGNVIAYLMLIHNYNRFNNKITTDKQKIIDNLYSNNSRDQLIDTYGFELVNKIEYIALNINANYYSIPENEINVIKEYNNEIEITKPTDLFTLLYAYNSIGLLDYFRKYKELAKKKYFNNNLTIIGIVILLILSTLFLFFFDSDVGVYYIYNRLYNKEISYSEKSYTSLFIYIFLIILVIFIFESLTYFLDRKEKSNVDSDDSDEVGVVPEPSPPPSSPLLFLPPPSSPPPSSPTPSSPPPSSPPPSSPPPSSPPPSSPDITVDPVETVDTIISTTKNISINFSDFNSFPSFVFIKGWEQKDNNIVKQIGTILLKALLFMFFSPVFISVFIALMYYLLNITIVA